MLRRTIAAAAIATVIGGLGAASAQAGTYTLPNGMKFTTTSKHVVTKRSTLQEFRAEHSLSGYTLPSGYRSTTVRAPRVVERATVQQFRAKYAVR